MSTTDTPTSTRRSPDELRALAESGATLLGDRTPAAWRTFAARVLFAAERPYLG